ncbi:site-specific DNA-methyltransferase [Sphingobium soli]|uniref:Site-specific DNA-methyltransferase n=1 Tax=Sphingobium soli TaxID=1591116 RepID=A0ABS8H8I1_9SPHN|nr:site-specific DNA-methyltransferase [Sphingobium soli]MCC4234856.1 site-specific DNA-methyltransferase [Sphingobium soli]
MTQPIHDILTQLGAAITAQLDAANDRATSAESQYQRLFDGLRALVNQPAANLPEAANDADEISVEVVEYPSTPPRGSTTTTRIAIPDDLFLDALCTEWRSAHAIRAEMASEGRQVAYGTVYKRLAKLEVELPDLIEAADAPVRWRLRSPRSKRRPDDAIVLEATTGSTRRARARGAMPPDAITDVRQRVADAPAPVEKFTPVLHRGDCFEIMKSMSDGSVDLILADPPYATTGLAIDPTIDLEAMWAEYRRIIKPTGTIILFGSQPFSSKLVCGAFDLFKQNLIWIKNRATGNMSAKDRPLKQHEDILVFSLGTTIQRSRSARRYTYNPLGQTSAGMKKVSAAKQTKYLHGVKHNPGLEYEGTTSNPRSTLYCPKDESHHHVFQKPLALLEYLIRTYSNEGDVVFDSFMGSGSTCVAALRSGRRSIGVEMTDDYFLTAQERVAATADQATPDVTPIVPPVETIAKSANDNAHALLPTASSNEVTIYNGDCLDTMRRMPTGSVDLVFTSPPYNLGRSSDGKVRGVASSGKWKGMDLSNGYASYDDARDPAGYIEWQKDVLRECWRLLADDGAIYYNHKPRVQNGVLQTPLDLNPGLPVRQIVIWDRGSGFNFNQSFYLPCHEWIVIFAKPGFRLRSKAASGMKDVWKVKHERNNSHPAPFPVELAERVIETTSAKIILDPFMGSGSTGVAALQCDRKFIGIEIDHSYCMDAASRMGLEGKSMAA